VIAALKRRGLIQEQVDDADGRRRRLAVTAAGHAVIEQIQPLRRAANRRLLAAVAPDQPARSPALPRPSCLDQSVGVREARRYPRRRARHAVGAVGYGRPCARAAMIAVGLVAGVRRRPRRRASDVSAGRPGRSAVEELVRLRCAARRSPGPHHLDRYGLRLPGGERRWRCSTWSGSTSRAASATTAPGT
jgi:hypothetical protein